MATKKVYFYKVSFLKSEMEINFNDLKAFVDKALRKLGKDKVITLDSDGDKITLDNYSNDSKCFFGRIGREQDISTLGKRDKSRALKPILSTTESEMWVDKLTYIYLDYELKLLIIVKSQSAPNANTFGHLINKYSKDHNIGLTSIPNTTFYRRLFEEGSAISKISFTIPVPNIEILQELPGVSSKQLELLKTMDVKRLELSISNGARKLLTSNNTDIENYILDSVENISQYEEFEIKGHAADSPSHTFDLKEELFSFAINIDHKKQVDGKKVYKEFEELTQEYKKKIKEAINENRAFLIGALS